MNSQHLSIVHHSLLLQCCLSSTILVLSPQSTKESWHAPSLAVDIIYIAKGTCLINHEGCGKIIFALFFHSSLLPQYATNLLPTSYQRGSVSLKQRANARTCYDLTLYYRLEDILQSYNVIKRLEHAYKSLWYSSKSISASNPRTCSVRIQEFLGTVWFEVNISRILGHILPNIQMLFGFWYSYLFLPEQLFQVC